MLKLLDTYRSILRFCGCKEVDGMIYSDIPGEEELNLLKIADRPWAMPTYDNLRDAYQKGYALFHPLNENIVKGESSDIKKLKKCINVHLNIVLFTLFESLLSIVQDSKLHKKLNPEQSELCVALKNVKLDQILEFKKTVMAGTTKPEMYGLVHVCLKRGGTLNEKRYSRTGNISFPFYEKLKEGNPFTFQEILKDGSIKSTTREFSSNEADLLMRLYEFVFPEVDVLNAYSFGSNSNTAPYLEALLKSTYNVVDRIVDVHLAFEDFIPDPSLYEFDIDWLQPFKDLNGYEKEIRTVQVTQTSNDTLESSSNNQNQIQGFTAPQQPVLTAGSNGIDPGSLSRSIAQRNLNAQINNPYYSAPMQQNVNQFMQMPYQQPAIGMDYPNQAYGQFGYCQNNIPSWARPNVPQQQMIQQPMYTNQFINPNQQMNQFQTAYSQPIQNTGQRLTLANSRAAY